MDDKTLLERAAKAAGIELRRWNNMYAGYETAQGVWNPLLDDGDALRLAVSLQMSLSLGPIRVQACTIEGALRGDFFHEDVIYQDSSAATRRAIVRAAAALASE